MERIEPHGLFEIFRPDDVAENIDGVSPELYNALWSIVDYYTGEPNPEAPDSCYADSLAYHWDKLTPELQLEANKLALREYPYMPRG